MTLNAKDVAAILQALEGSTFDSLDLEMEGVKLQLRRTSRAVAPGGARAAGHASSAVTSVSQATAAQAMAMPALPADVPHGVHPTPSGRNAPPVEFPAGTVAVPAPLLGIFYRAPKPGEPAFVEEGARVEADTIIGIIEVMKLMNTVRAGVRGEIVAIPARNGELVEYGEALLFVRPG